MASTTVYVKNELATELELNDTVSHNWEGQFSSKLWKVEPGNEGRFEHKGDPVSAAGVVYRVKNKDGKEWDWIVAWDNQYDNRKDQVETKIYTSIVEEIWDPSKFDWNAIRKELVNMDELVVADHGLQAKLNTEKSKNSAIIKATISYYSVTTITTTVNVKNELASEIELNDTITHNWEGEFGNKLWKVEPGKDGQFVHKGAPGSAAGVVYRAKNKDGKEWDWIVAWDVQAETNKIYTAIVEEIWDPSKIDWSAIHEELVSKDVLAVVGYGLEAQLSIVAGEGSAKSAIINATISYMD